MEDSYRHKGLRKKLAEVIQKKGITDVQVLKAIETIPRHLLIPDNALHKFAYEDKPFPIGSGQTISQPYTVAFQTEQLSLKKRDKVLEIGTGSGYQTAVLLEMGTKVFFYRTPKKPFLIALRCYFLKWDITQNCSLAMGIKDYPLSLHLTKL